MIQKRDLPIRVNACSCNTRVASMIGCKKPRDRIPSLPLDGTTLWYEVLPCISNWYRAESAAKFVCAEKLLTTSLSSSPPNPTIITRALCSEPMSYVWTLDWVWTAVSFSWDSFLVTPTVHNRDWLKDRRLMQAFLWAPCMTQANVQSIVGLLVAQLARRKTAELWGGFEPRSHNPTTPSIRDAYIRIYTIHQVTHGKNCINLKQVNSIFCIWFLFCRRHGLRFASKKVVYFESEPLLGTQAYECFCIM